MKRISIVSAVATALCLSSAFAAETQVASVAIAQANVKTSSKKTVSKKSMAARTATPSTQIYRAKQSDAISNQRSSATRAVHPMGGTTATTAAAVKAPMAKKSPFSIGANFYYYGSSLAEPLRSYQSDIDSGEGYSGAPVTLETHFVFAYKLTNNMTISANPYFTSNANYRKFNAKTNNYDAKDGTPFALLSPYLKLAFGKFAQVGKFKWNGDFRVYPGIGAAMHELPLYLRTGQNFYYTLAPKVTLAAYNTIRYYKYTNSLYSRDATKRNIRITAAPAIEYQAMDNLGLALAYNMEVQHAHTKTWSPLQWDNPYKSYFEAGIAWDITKRVNLTPYIDVYPQKLKAYNSLVGFNLALSIL